MKKNQFFIGIDFGSKNTKCAVLIEREHDLKIFDIFETPLEDSFETCHEKYVAAITDISNYLKSKKVLMRSFVCNLSNRSIRSHRNYISMKNHFIFNKIRKSFLRKLEKKVLCAKIDQDECLLSQYLGNVVVDGKVVVDAKKHVGKLISQDSVSVIAKTKDLVELRNAVQEVGLHVEHVIASNTAPFAILNQVPLMPSEFSLYIDIGEQLTNFSIYSTDQILYSGNFEFGGENISHMLSEEMGYTFTEAETFKCKFLCGALMEKEFPQKKELNRYTKRLRNEIFVMLQLMKRDIEKTELKFANCKNIVLSGSTSRLPLLSGLVQEFFQKPCTRVGEGSYKYFLNYLIKPEFCCATGLAYQSYLKRRKIKAYRAIPTELFSFCQDRFSKILYSD